MPKKVTEKYNEIKTQLRKYSFQYLKVSEEPVVMLEYLKEEYDDIIERVQNPNLLAAAIVFIYVKKAGLGGRGGITAKQIGEYFGVSASSISQKVFDLEYIFDEDIDDDIFDIDEEEMGDVWDVGGMFVDADRFEIAEQYWDFLESEVADDPQKSITALKKIIKKDPDYYDPYISLYEYYMDLHDTKNAVDILEKGYERVMKRLAPHGIFPEELSWDYMENRHIIRLLFNVATLYWAIGKTLNALSIFLQLLRSNPQDNIGARYAAVALLEGYQTYEHFEMEFAKDGTMDIVFLMTWFDAKVLKHQEFMGCWLAFSDEDI